MATWITKPWIEQALITRKEESLPRIARAQILKLKVTSTSTVGIISDKQLFVKASFSQAAVEQFKRENPSLSIGDIQGGLIFVKKYALEACMENESGDVEFMLKVDEFKFAGGEGNTQFGSNIIDSSTFPPLQPRLQELWRIAQLPTMIEESKCESHFPSLKQMENTLLQNHELVFIPDDMEKKLAEIPEWKPKYCPPQTSEVQSEFSSFGSTSNPRLQGSCEGYAKSGEHLAETNSGLQQLENSGLSMKGEYTDQPTLQKENKEQETTTTDHKTAAFIENCGEFSMNRSVTSCARVPMFDSFKGEGLVTGSEQTSGSYMYPTTENSADNTGSGFKVTKSSGQPPHQFSAAATSSQAKALRGVAHSHVHGIKEKGTDMGNSKFSSQQQNNGPVISDDRISSSQKSIVVSQPLRGLVTEEHCSPSSEFSQVKTKSDLSYSILREKSCPTKKSPAVNIVMSSENSEEIEIEQPLPCITPQRNDNHIHCSLTESQLENLLDTSMSINEATSTPCFENVPNASQVEKNSIKLRAVQESKSCSENKMANGSSSSNQLGLDNLTVGQSSVLSSLNSTGKKFISERVVCHTLGKTLDFDTLYSQNTWSFSQACEMKCNGDLDEFYKHQSGKRKRSNMDDHMHLTCPKHTSRAQLSSSPISPDSTSRSVKSSSHSGSSQSQQSNHSSSVYLGKPLELYSQQDPLVLDTSADSTESTGDVIDNESGLLISCEVHKLKSPSILDHSMEEPCTLTTPTFDSLPSYQVPAANRVTSPDTSPTHDQQSEVKQQLSGTWRQESETNKKRNNLRRGNFNWFSDAF